MKGLKVWFLETRPQFLTLSVVLAFLGTAIAWYDGYFHLGYAVLAGIGLIFAHAAVNILNDYFDFRSGIDLATRRTPFSGGSGILPAGLLRPSQALWLGIAMLVLAVPIGIYFTIIRNWQLLPLLMLAALFIVLYSPLILKHYWPEWAAGAGLGALPILGMYFVQTGAYTPHVAIACIPSAFLVHNLLLLNELPDAEADRKANRRTLPITIGKHRTAIFYAAVNIAVYIWVIVWALIGTLPRSTLKMPLWTLLALLTLPLAIKAIRGAFSYNEPAKLVAGMGANVMNVLLTQFLIGIGYIIDHAI